MRVNGVNPGVIKTDLYLNNGMSKEQLEMFFEHCKETHALGRLGDVMDVANAITFLANEDTNYITGVTLSVDGGKQLMCPL